MSLLRALRRMFGSDIGEPLLIDSVVITGTPDWRAEKLKAAADRHGKPFACAADGLPREIIVDGKPVDIARVRGGNVTRLAERKRKP